MLLTRAFVMAAIAAFAYAIPLPRSTQSGTTHGKSLPTFKSSNIGNGPFSQDAPMTKPHETNRGNRIDAPMTNPGNRIKPHETNRGNRIPTPKPGITRVDDRRNDPYERYLHRHPTYRPVIVPVIINGGITHEYVDVAFERPVVVNTGGFIDYSRMAVFSQEPTFQYSSCQSISQDLQFFIGGFYQIVATVQATSWDVDRVTSVFGEFCFNLDLLSQRLAIYDYSSDSYPTCREEFVNAVVQFLKELQGFLSVIQQRYGSYQIFDGIMSQCYSALQRFFGIMQSMNVNTDQVYSQVDVNIFAQASLPIQPFRNADSVSLLRGAFNYSGN